MRRRSHGTTQEKGFEKQKKTASPTRPNRTAVKTSQTAHVLARALRSCISRAPCVHATETVRAARVTAAATIARHPPVVRLRTPLPFEPRRTEGKEEKKNDAERRESLWALATAGSGHAAGSGYTSGHAPIPAANASRRFLRNLRSTTQPLQWPPRLSGVHCPRSSPLVLLLVLSSSKPSPESPL